MFAGRNTDCNSTACRKTLADNSGTVDRRAGTAGTLRTPGKSDSGGGSAGSIVDGKHILDGSGARGASDDGGDGVH